MLHLLWKIKENHTMFKEHWGEKVRAFIQLRISYEPHTMWDSQRVHYNKDTKIKREYLTTAKRTSEIQLEHKKIRMTYQKVY